MRRHVPKKENLEKSRLIRTYRECGFGEEKFGKDWTRYDINNFSFFMGEPNTEALEDPGSLLIPLSKPWQEYFRQHPDDFEAIERYAMEVDNFEEERLEDLIIPEESEYDIVEVDAEIFNRLKSEEWSADLVQAYEDFEEYDEWGAGFVKMKDGEIAGGISAYIPYEDGYEVEIDVHPEHQSQGLGKSLASYFILNCIENDATPYWDAHTEVSRDLALKLGYKVTGSYTAYVQRER